LPSSAGFTVPVPPAPLPQKNGPNIASADVDELGWNPNDLQQSLERLKKYVLAVALRSENWYWKRKSAKARAATIIQWTAIVATGFAGLVPIAAKLGLFSNWFAWLRAMVTGFDSGLFASLLIGGGAALLNVDRFAGLSSGWTRYVLTATAIRAASAEFRVDWAALTAQAATPPTPDHTAAMIQRAKAFSLAIEALITKETQDWATEFRQNLMTLERDLKVQVDQAQANRDKAEQEKAKAEREKAEQEKTKAEQEKLEQQKAAQPGSIQLRVPNARTTDDFQFNAKLENKASVIVDEPMKGSESWTRIDVIAGQYKLTISGTVKLQPVASSKVLIVKPGEMTELELSFPASPPASGP